LDVQLFTTPTWLLDEGILKNIEGNPIQVVSQSQEAVLNRITSNHTLYKLISAEAEDGQSAYKVSDLFGDMNTIVFRELKSNQVIDVYRRNLQKMYVEKLIDLVKPTPPADATAALLAGGRRGGAAAGPRDGAKELTDVVSIAKAQLRAINSMIKTALPGASDSMTNAHLQDLS